MAYEFTHKSAEYAETMPDICDLVQELLSVAHNKTSPCVIDITKALSETLKVWF